MEKDILRNKNARKESKKQALVESTDVPSADDEEEEEEGADGDSSD